MPPTHCRHPGWLLTAIVLIILSGLARPGAGAEREPDGVLAGAADPTIIAAPGDGNGYYVFATGRGLPFYHSDDMVHWSRVGRVFSDPVPAWAAEKVPGTRGIWAPHIERIGDLYHLYYSCSTFGKQRSVIGLAVNRALDPDDPDYRWEDRGEVISSKPGDSFNAIDPATFMDHDRKLFLFWGSFWSGIKAIELDPQTGTPRESAKVIDIADRREPPNAIEAPYVIRREGYCYLFVSFDNCCDGARSTYRVMVGRSRKAFGPYRDAHGRSLLEGGGTLVIKSCDRWRGPGHNSILHEDGQDWLVHHTYDMEHLRRHRILQIRPLYWTESGWPVAGEPLVLTHDLPKVDITPRSVLGTWTRSESGRRPREERIELLAGGKLRGEEYKGSWALRGNRLTLRWTDPQAPGGARVDELVVEVTGKTFTGRDDEHDVIRGRRVKVEDEKRDKEGASSESRVR